MSTFLTCSTVSLTPIFLRGRWTNFGSSYAVSGRWEQTLCLTGYHATGSHVRRHTLDVIEPTAKGAVSAAYS